MKANINIAFWGLTVCSLALVFAYLWAPDAPYAERAIKNASVLALFLSVTAILNLIFSLLERLSQAAMASDIGSVPDTEANTGQPTYQTFVVRNAQGDEIPRTLLGGEVCSWAAGHALAEAEPLHAFVMEVCEGWSDDVDEIVEQAKKVSSLAERQRKTGYEEPSHE